MKLKKAMKLYPIEVNQPTNPHYSLGERAIFRSSDDLWWISDAGSVMQYTEKKAVEWLIEGAKKIVDKNTELLNYDGHKISVIIDDEHIEFITECPYCGCSLP